MKKNPTIFIEHILESITDIEEFSEGLSKEMFVKDKLKQNAIIRSIEVIGEAVKNLPAGFRTRYSDVPWTNIAGMRDKLMHHYFGVDLETVWKVVKSDLPYLKEEIFKIKNKLITGEKSKNKKK